MRTLRRPAIVPPTLRTTGAGGKAHARNVGRFDAQADTFAAKVDDKNQKQEPSFPDHWLSPDVRGALRGFQGDICAFCGQALARGNRGDVEHFRPKSAVAGVPNHDGYWWLAYSFDNYVLACRTCNSSHKGTRFPLLDEAGRVTFSTKDKVVEEPRGLWDPCADDLDAAITVDVESAIARVGPSATCSAPLRARVDDSIRFFHVNNDTQLIKARMEVLDKALELAVAGDYHALRQLASPVQSHSLVARCVLARFAPQEATELTAAEAMAQRWQDWRKTLEPLAILIDEWAGALEHAQQVGDSARAETARSALKARQKERQELQWEIAVARHAMAPSVVLALDALLQQVGYLGDVQAIAASL